MAGSQEHIKPLRLFDFSRADAKPTEEEKEHLRICQECVGVLAIFARQFGKKRPPNDKPENAA